MSETEALFILLKISPDGKIEAMPVTNNEEEFKKAIATLKGLMK